MVFNRMTTTTALKIFQDPAATIKLKMTTAQQHVAQLFPGALHPLFCP
jgi:hypothetical protein